LQLSAEAAQFSFDGKGRRAAEAEWAALSAIGAQLLPYDSAAYPERLREIYDPPPVLWLRGEPSLLARPAIAIVGTRHPSPYGSGVAEMLVRDLAARRLLVVSGWPAASIPVHTRELSLTDAQSGGVGHRARCGLSQGKQKAVGGDSRDRRRNPERGVAGNISGATERSATQPHSERVSIAVLLVEAAENSGTRVTARCAAEQNRDLFAVPGNVTNKNSWTP